MIINAIRAENVLKYALLELQDIPEKGLIAVIGDNESGKSSIGEGICFALFGRTFSLAEKDLDKVIRWGESRCSIKLDFTTPSGRSYRISRFLDELGNHSASIGRIGEEPMIRGVAEVEAALKDIIGFGYTEFIESFYLAQREITTPHPHSFAVKAMAGVEALEKVVASCRGELARAQEQLVEGAAQQADIASQIAALGLDPGRLATLEAQRGAEQSALDEDRRRIGALKAAAAAYGGVNARLQGAARRWLAVKPEASFRQRQVQLEGLDLLLADLAPQADADPRTAAPHAELRAFAEAARARLAAFDSLRREAATYRERLARLLGEAEATGSAGEEPTYAARQGELVQLERRTASSLRIARALMFACLVPALAAWGLWGLLGLAPDSQQAQALTAWLAGLAPRWEIPAWFPPSAAILTPLFIAFLARGSRLRSRLQGHQGARAQTIDEEQVARREAARLAQLDEMPLPAAAALLSELRDEGLVRQVSEFTAAAGTALLDPDAHAADQGAIGYAVAKLEAGLAECKTQAEREIDRLHEAVTKHASDVARLDEGLVHEGHRVRRHGELATIAVALQSRIEEIRHRIGVRELAIDLLHGAIHYISQRFNTEVRNLSANSLPKFTNGRYEHLQIDENLKVKAFSNEKRDFMDLDEISSGTQRQIMLAVRLALSQKLVNSAIHGPQMLFLDEPFAFFDEGRTASALAVLPKVSDDFTQIWVTSQTFPAQSRFDLSIECNARQSVSPAVRRGPLDEGAP